MERTALTSRGSCPNFLGRTLQLQGLIFRAFLRLAVRTLREGLANRICLENVPSVSGKLPELFWERCPTSSRKFPELLRKVVQICQGSYINLSRKFSSLSRKLPKLLEKTGQTSCARLFSFAGKFSELPGAMLRTSRRNLPNFTEEFSEILKTDA